MRWIDGIAYSPAQIAGLQVGDIITSINGTDIKMQRCSEYGFFTSTRPHEYFTQQ